jgi:hypothetical protein
MTFSTKHSTDLRGLDLGGQSVEVNQEKAAELMHLIGHIGGGLLVTMHGLISIEPEFVRPSLKFGRDFIRRSHLIDAFFDLPRFDIRRKGFERKLHGLPIHRASRVEVSGAARSRSLIESIRNGTRYIAWSIDHAPFRIDSFNKIMLRGVEQISTKTIWRHSTETFDDRNDRVITHVAYRRHCYRGIHRRAGKLASVCESSFDSITVRTVEDEARHDVPNYQKGIVA